MTASPTKALLGREPQGFKEAVGAVTERFSVNSRPAAVNTRGRQNTEKAGGNPCRQCIGVADRVLQRQGDTPRPPKPQPGARTVARTIRKSMVASRVQMKSGAEDNEWPA
jgi:hypothetical protein